MRVYVVEKAKIRFSPLEIKISDNMGSEVVVHANRLILELHCLNDVLDSETETFTNDAPKEYHANVVHVRNLNTDGWYSLTLFHHVCSDKIAEFIVKELHLTYSRLGD